jgi:hypothetical protein
MLALPLTVGNVGKLGMNAAQRFFRDVVFGLAFLAVCALLVLLDLRTEGRFSFAWFGVVIWGTLVCYAVAVQYRTDWAHAEFWALLLLLFCLHCVLFASILRRFPEFPAIWFVPLAFIEGWSWIVILEVVLTPIRKWKGARRNN